MAQNPTLDRILAELRESWNTGDGRRLAAVFADDATMVDVRGRKVLGRATIEQEHRTLFETVFRGATFEIELLDSRSLGAGVVIAHTVSTATVPGGPRAGRHGGIQTMVVRDGEILAFHNTGRATE
jgi:uncharacterized protein (TIGR02246 family)